MKFTVLFSISISVSMAAVVAGFQPQWRHTPSERNRFILIADGSSKLVRLTLTDEQVALIHEQQEDTGRRSLFQKMIRGATATCILSTITTTNGGLPQLANAGIDPAMLKNLPVQGDESGAAQRLRQVEAIQRPASDVEYKPFEQLPSGVSYREYREGKGGAVVQPGSKVAVETTIRCKSFATANEPGGLKYFSTKDDTEFNELAWTIGSGELSPALEEGMMGMHKNGLRRIEIPSTAAFAARNANQLPLPTTKDGKRRFENLFKTNATLLFEVLVTRIK